MKSVANGRPHDNAQRFASLLDLVLLARRSKQPRLLVLLAGHGAHPQLHRGHWARHPIVVPEDTRLNHIEDTDTSSPVAHHYSPD